MAQQVKATWMSRLHESDLTQAVEGTTSFSFREVTLPTCHAATAKGKLCDNFAYFRRGKKPFLEKFL